MFMYMVHLFVRIDFEPSNCAFGPGKAQLLERLSEYGTLRRAAASMGMSYRKAWLLVQEMEAQFNRAVVTAETGGTGGGGMHLTEPGHDSAEDLSADRNRRHTGKPTRIAKHGGHGSGNAAPRHAAKRKRYPPPAKLKNSRRPKKRRR